MGNNQDPHVIKKKYADGRYNEETAVINAEGDFEINQSKTQGLPDKNDRKK